jgi:hypothetical protein
MRVTVRGMPRKSIPISTRISSEDAEFLAKWKGSGEATPSEKIRAMIAEMRRQTEGAKDYSAALHVATGLITPTVHAIRTHEHEAAMHSELVARIADWLPECLAFLIAAAAGRDELDRGALVEIEEGLAGRVMILMQSVLQMAVTSQCPCYNPQVVKERIQPVLDLAEVVFLENDRLKRGDWG